MTCAPRDRANTTQTNNQGRKTPGFEGDEGAGITAGEGMAGAGVFMARSAAEGAKGVVDGEEEVLDGLGDIGQAGGDEHGLGGRLLLRGLQ